jgi:hypothetical protein
MAKGQQAAINGNRRKGRARWLIVLGAAVFCVAVLFALYNAEPVEVAKSHLEQSGGQVYIAGQVTIAVTRRAPSNLSCTTTMVAVTHSASIP